MLYLRLIFPLIHFFTQILRGFLHRFYTETRLNLCFLILREICVKINFLKTAQLILGYNMRMVI